MRTGYADLPLHGGKAPFWLFSRMKKLAREIAIFIVSEFGKDELLRRLSDPIWFQALGCVLGFDWHSSGLTTTTCGALKAGLKDIFKDLDIYICGGKGKTSRKTPEQITSYCESLGKNPEKLVYMSKMSAKIDSSALQDGYQVYFHSFIFTSSGNWCVVQQGMNQKTGFARRYHWLKENIKSLVCEPHSAICCNKKSPHLNLVAAESDSTREKMALLSSTPPEKLLNELKTLKKLKLPARHFILLKDINLDYLKKPFLSAYLYKPQDFESLLSLKGVGAKTLRALALLSELIFDTKVSFRDPARFSFAHGGKDGHPYPVNLKIYDKSIEILRKAISSRKLQYTERKYANMRLDKYLKSFNPE